MGHIVLVRGDAVNGTAGDLALQARLEAAGHTVTRVADDDPEYGGAYDGVVISDSCSGGTVGSKYDTVAKPGITCENVQWRLGSYLSGITGTSWTIENVAGNAGLTGDHAIYSEPVSQQGVDSDTLPAAATVVARLTGDADHGAYVVYEAGGALTSGTAPARRVFLRIGDAAVPVLTAAGTALLDAAIEWAFGTGAATVTGTAALDLGEVAVDAVGTRSTSGTVAVDLGELAVTATGRRIVPGAASLPLGALTVAAEGVVVPEVVHGVVSVALSAPSVAASGVRIVRGTADVPVGPLELTATGEGLAEVVHGVAEFVLGGVEVTATGVRVVTGTAAVDGGPLELDALGEVLGGAEVVTGTAAVDLGELAVTASGTRKPSWIQGGQPRPVRGLYAGVITTGGRRRTATGA